MFQKDDVLATDRPWEATWRSRTESGRSKLGDGLSETDSVSYIDDEDDEAVDDAGPVSDWIG